MMRSGKLLFAAGGAALLLGLLPGRGAAAPRVLIEARDLPRLVGFYGDDLELTVAARDSATGQTAFDAAGTELVLRRGQREGGEGLVRILLSVANLDAARDRLRALGISPWEARSRDGDPIGLFFEDPEGNPLGFVLDSVPTETWLAPFAPGQGPRAAERSGRVPLMVFGGGYGIWLGVALPLGLGSGDPTIIGLSILAGGPLGVLAARAFDRAEHPTRGRAGAISLGGTFATWQGLGWAGAADVDGEDALLIGVGAGLAGIGLAAAITDDVPVSEGQTSLLGAAVNWGAWYGLVGTMVTDDNASALVPMLATSAAGLAAGTVWCLSHDIEVSRVRLISLGGVVGTAVGFGLDVVFQNGDSRSAFAIAGAAGVAGLVAAARWTREPDDRADGWDLGPPSLHASADGALGFSLLNAKF